MNPSISIVIRCKNEEKWLSSCLSACTLQSWHDIEIILVDNDSTDNSLEIANYYNATILNIPSKNFNFSRALNIGIQASRGEYVAILSAHCIPQTDQWLSVMASHFTNSDIAAVYGRQEPLPDTKASDKRDLWITFGLDRRIQTKDYFFHNANSMIRKSVWNQLHFNEEIHGVEDQDWARKIQKLGHQIVYEPLASVYHHHGIHHSQNEDRALRVTRVLEQIRTS